MAYEDYWGNDLSWMTPTKISGKGTSPVKAISTTTPTRTSLSNNIGQEYLNMLNQRATQQPSGSPIASAQFSAQQNMGSSMGWMDSGVAGGGGYTGGSGGGGGGYAPGGTLGAGGTSLQQASQNALQANIDAMQAQYDMTLAELSARGGDIGARADFMLAQLARQEQYETESTLSGLVQRGVYRSGITARDLGRLGAMFSERRAEIELERSAQLRGLQFEAGKAKADLGLGVGGAYGEIEAGNTQAELAEISNTGEVGAGLPTDQGAYGVTQIKSGYVSVDDLVNSMDPIHREGLTPQDLANLKEFYPEGIPPDVAQTIAARAASIATGS